MPISKAYSTGNKPNEFVSVVDFGAVGDGVTDDTGAILDAASNHNLLYIPYNTKYDPQTLLATLPTDTVIIDDSSINDYQAAGQTTKRVGILSKDEATSDTHFYIGSDHHAILQMNNYGGAGSTSAGERKASRIWCTGQFENGSVDKQGFRGAAVDQYTKVSGQNFWQWGIRSLAPWAAIDADYEDWLTAESIGSTGIYRRNGSNHYVSASTGTTGATAPTHTTGTVSDGGVDWTWVDSSDRTVFAFREDGRVQFGTGSFSNTFTYTPGLTDASNGTCTAVFAARPTTASQAATLRLTPTDSGGSASNQPYLRGEDGVGLRIMNSGGSTDVGYFDDNGFNARAIRKTHATASAGDTTPSVAGISTLYLGNGSPTNVTDLDGEVDNQVVTLIATNGNTTLVHAATFSLTGSVNVTLGAYDSVTMQKVPTAISDRWVEISRSIK